MFDKVEVILSHCRRLGVGFSMVYDEGDNSWYFTIESSAPAERFIGKNHSFDLAVEATLEWLEKLC